MESGVDKKQEDIVELQEIELKHATKEIPNSTQESDTNQQSIIPNSKQPPIEEV